MNDPDLTTAADLAEFLIDWRVKRGLTHAAAGELFGVDGYTYMRWEQGQNLERYAAWHRGWERLTGRGFVLRGHKIVTSGIDSHQG